MGYSSSNTTTSIFLYFFSFSQRWLSGSVFFSIWGGSLGLLDLSLPPNCVCAVKASASHKGYFLSTAEDSKHRQNKPTFLFESQANNTHASIGQREAGMYLYHKALREVTETQVYCEVFFAETLKMNFMWWKKKKPTVKWNCTVIVGLPVCSAISAPNYLVT